MKLTIAVTSTVIDPPAFAGLTSPTLQFTFDVPVVDAGEAPVAVRLPGRFSREREELRFFDGKFYGRNISHDYVQPIFRDGVPTALHIRRNPDLEPRAEAERQLLALLQELVIIDGEFWKPVPEPAYVLDSLGMSVIVTDADGFPDWRVFNLNEQDAAIETAARLRYDNSMIEPNPDAFDTAEVLMPEAVKTPKHSVRIAAAHRKVQAAVAEALELLAETTPRNMHNAGTLLINAAEEMMAATGGIRADLLR